MKNFFLLIMSFLLLQTFSGLGQSFAPLGATWVYEYNPSFWGPNLLKGQITLTVTGEQEMEGKKCRVILENLSGTYSQSGEKINQNVRNHYIYEDGGKVYLYSKASFFPFNLLYDFNATKNQSWSVYGDEFSCKDSEENLCKVTVDSVGEEKFDNKTLKVQYVSPNSPISNDRYYYFNGGKIIHNIGGLGRFFPEPSGILDGYSGGPLRCYTDANVGTIKFGGNCDGTLSTTASELSKNIATIVQDGKIKVSGIATTDIGITIYSAQGVTLFQSVVPVTENACEIAIAPSWKQGIYVLKVTTQGNTQQTSRFIVQ